MENIARVGIDLAKRVFHVTAVDAAGAVVERRKLRRPGLQSYLARLPRAARSRWWRAAAATEPTASMPLARRTCGVGLSASRPCIAPRRAGRWRRWRRPGRGVRPGNVRRACRRRRTGAARGGGRLRVRRARRAGGPRLDGGGAGGRCRRRAAGAADGRRERPERPARSARRRPGMELTRAGETMMRAVAVFVGREV